MRIGIIAKYVFLPVAVAFVALMLAYASQMHSIYDIVLFLAIASFLVCVAMRLWYDVARSHERRRMKDEMARLMGILLHYKTSGASFVCSLEKAAYFAEIDSARKRLLSIARRIRLGGEARVEDVAELEGFSDFGSARKAVDSYRMSAEERNSSLEAHAQRDATIGMFLSTILPSFIIFSFVGSTIISPGSTGMFMFSVAMLIALPLILSVSAARLNRRLFE